MSDGMMWSTPPPISRRGSGESNSSMFNKYGPSYGTPSSSYVERGSPPRQPLFGSTVEGSSRYYSELPPMGYRKRRRNSNWAKWTTRMVLASPLLVLFLWSLALALHGGKTVTVQTKKMAASKMSRNAVRQFSAKSRARGSKATQGYIPVVQTETLGKASVNGDSSTLQDATMTASAQQSNRAEPNAIPVSQATNGRKNDGNGGNIPIIGPLGDSVEQITNSNLMTNTNGNSGASVQTSLKETASLQNQNQVLLSQNTNQFAANSNGNQRMAVKLKQAVQMEPQTASDGQAEIMENSNSGMSKSSSTTYLSPKVYFYDANVVSKDGQLVIPDVVFDENGTPVKLESLNDGKTEIFLEPPMAASAQASSNNVQEENMAQADPKMTFGENVDITQAQDQLIIVMTVATMALLVGALSARRMRSRHFLSSCIENESLEDELAYDTAISSSYDTFAWKGDLEKFDV